ncbi:MAG: VWA domain-containing protein [Pyrinomonadaceae bacterium]
MYPRSPFPQPRKSNVTAPPTQDSVPVSYRRLDYGEARRTMALVVDDMGLDFESTVFVRDALKKFVDEEVKSDDLVAILRTGKDSGVLQQLTTDKQQLQAAAARIRYNHMSRESIDQFTPMELPALSKATVGGSPIKDQAAVGEDSVFDDFRDHVSTDATLVTLSLVIRGLGKLPGRKSVVLFSNGVRFSVGSNQDSKYSTASLRLQKQAELLMDHANRASVVIYTVGPRGLTAPFIIRDNPSGRSPDELRGVFQSRAKTTFYKQAGLSGWQRGPAASWSKTQTISCPDCDVLPQNSKATI